MVKLSGRAARVWLITFVLRGPRPAPEQSRTSLIDRIAELDSINQILESTRFVNGLKRLGSSNARRCGRFNLTLSLALTSFRVRVYSMLETAFHFCAGAAVPDLTAGFQRPLNDFDSRSAELDCRSERDNGQRR